MASLSLWSNSDRHQHQIARVALESANVFLDGIVSRTLIKWKPWGMELSSGPLSNGITPGTSILRIFELRSGTLVKLTVPN